MAEAPRTSPAPDAPPAKKPRPDFQWDDPLHLADQLTDE